MSQRGTGHGRLWSFVTGERGVNRVRVYERTDGGPIWIEWFDNAGRHQETLTNLTGMPIRDKDLAKKIAEKSALKQREKREAKVLQTLFGIKADHTVAELIEKYHAAKETSWSQGHKRGQLAARKFWESALKGYSLTDVTPARVREAIVKEGKRRDGAQWSARTRGRLQAYVKELFIYAYSELRWIEHDQQLDGVKIEKSDGDSLPYSQEETRKILEAAASVDLRIAALCWIAALTGRRSTAIVTLPKSAYSVEKIDDEFGDVEFGVIQFPAHTDKVRKAGRVVLCPKARVVVEELLAQPAVKHSKWLFPGGKDLNRATATERPISGKTVIRFMRRVEEKAGVEQIPRRAVHGLKRRWSTDALPIDALAAGKSAGTRVDMLGNRYAADEDKPKARLALALEGMLA